MPTSFAPALLPGRPGSGGPSPFHGDLLEGRRWPWLRRLPKLGRWADDFVFRGNHRHRLVYNACWEDPVLDRELLNLNAASRVVMITSAGCNALDYLLDGPAEIHAVDVNPRQNALLDLKLALIAAGRFEMRTLVLRRFRGLWEDLSLLLEADSLEEQRRAFGRIEPRLWNAFTCWLLRRPATLSLLGVPRAQTSLIVEQWPGGILGYLRDKLRWVATEIPMRDNYFWRVYIQGAYTRECCPNYLRHEHFDRLRRRAHRVRTHTCLLSSFLLQNPAPYSHYVLLDLRAAHP